jgi:hypothetical protein
MVSWRLRAENPCWTNQILLEVLVFLVDSCSRISRETGDAGADKVNEWRRGRARPLKADGEVEMDN